MREITRLRVLVLFGGLAAASLATQDPPTKSLRHFKLDGASVPSGSYDDKIVFLGTGVATIRSVENLSIVRHVKASALSEIGTVVNTNPPTLVTVNKNGLRLWSLPDLTPLSTVAISGLENRLELDRELKIIFLHRRNRAIMAYRVAAGKLELAATLKVADLQSFRWAPLHKKLLIVRSAHHGVWLWDGFGPIALSPLKVRERLEDALELNANKIAGIYENHEMGILGPTLTPSLEYARPGNRKGEHLIVRTCKGGLVLANRGVIYFFDGATNECEPIWEPSTGDILGFSILPNGEELIVSEAPRSLALASRVRVAQ